jgi:class 3 adenylate cyclase
MTILRTTVIMKTDISGSTLRFRALPEADLHAVLDEHRDFLGRHAATYEGRIVKPEGDGFWLVFPSVTAAALAAMTMQDDLRLAQLNRGDDRLAVRIVITLGDVLHQEGALVGDTVVLTARIEAFTPPDEIYLSAAAWLAVNQAEVRTAYVDTFSLKGFADPVAVYRVEQTHRTRVIANQYVVFTDLRGFGALVAALPMTRVEKLLDALYELTNQVAREFDGTIRFSAGDAYCLTFTDAGPAMTAAERLREGWSAFERQEQLRCSMVVAVHQGTLYAYRSYFFGQAINIAGGVQDASRTVLPPDEGAIFITGEVRRNLVGTLWDRRLELVDVGWAPPRLPKVEIYRLGEAAHRAGGSALPPRAYQAGPAQRTRAPHRAPP